MVGPGKSEAARGRGSGGICRVDGVDKGAGSGELLNRDRPGDSYFKRFELLEKLGSLVSLALGLASLDRTELARAREMLTECLRSLVEVLAHVVGDLDLFIFLDRLGRPDEEG